MDEKTLEKAIKNEMSKAYLRYLFHAQQDIIWSDYDNFPMYQYVSAGGNIYLLRNVYSGECWMTEAKDPIEALKELLMRLAHAIKASQRKGEEVRK